MQIVLIVISPYTQTYAIAFNIFSMCTNSLRADTTDFFCTDVTESHSDLPKSEWTAVCEKILT